MTHRGDKRGARRVADVVGGKTCGVAGDDCQVPGHVHIVGRHGIVEGLGHVGRVTHIQNEKPTIHVRQIGEIPDHLHRVALPRDAGYPELPQNRGIQRIGDVQGVESPGPGRHIGHVPLDVHLSIAIPGESPQRSQADGLRSREDVHAAGGIGHVSKITHHMNLVGLDTGEVSADEFDGGRVRDVQQHNAVVEIRDESVVAIHGYAAGGATRVGESDQDGQGGVTDIQDLQAAGSVGHIDPVSLHGHVIVVAGRVVAADLGDTGRIADVQDHDVRQVVGHVEQIALNVQPLAVLVPMKEPSRKGAVGRRYRPRGLRPYRRPGRPGPRQGPGPGASPKD